MKFTDDIEAWPVQIIIKKGQYMNGIIIIQSNQDGKMELTVDELQKMLDRAYDQGRIDGRASIIDELTHFYGKPYQRNGESITIDYNNGTTIASNHT